MKSVGRVIFILFSNIVSTLPLRSGEIQFNDLRKIALNMEYSKAITYFDKYISSVSDPKLKVRGYIWKSWLLFQDKKLELAEAEIKNALNIRYDAEVKETFWPNDFVSFFRNTKRSIAYVDLRSLPMATVRVKDTSVTTDVHGRASFTLKKGSYTMLLRKENIIALKDIDITSGGKIILEFYPQVYKTTIDIYPKVEDAEIYINGERFNISDIPIMMGKGMYSIAVKASGYPTFSGNFEVTEGNDNRFLINFLLTAKKQDRESERTEQDKKFQELSKIEHEGEKLKEQRVPKRELKVEQEKEKVEQEKEKIEQKTPKAIASVPLREERIVKIIAEPAPVSISLKDKSAEERPLGDSPLEIKWDVLSQKTLVFRKSGYAQRILKPYSYSPMIYVKLIPQMLYDKFSEVKRFEYQVSNSTSQDKAQKLKEIFQLYKKLDKESDAFPPVLVALSRVLIKVAQIEGLTKAIETELSRLKGVFSENSGEPFFTIQRKFIDAYLIYKRCEDTDSVADIKFCTDSRKLVSEIIKMYSNYEIEDEFFDLDQFELLYFIKARSTEKIACLKKQEGLSYLEDMDNAIRAWEEYDFPPRHNPNNPLKPVQNPFANLRMQRLMLLTQGECAE